MNLNDLAKEITMKEGKAKSLSIAQVKEVMKIFCEYLAGLSDKDVAKILAKYRRT